MEIVPYASVLFREDYLNDTVLFGKSLDVNIENFGAQFGKGFQGQEFGSLWYFFRIEVAKSRKGRFISYKACQTTSRQECYRVTLPIFLIKEIV